MPRIPALIATLAALVILASCAQSAAPAPAASASATPAPAASAGPEETAQAFVQALGAWDENALRRMIATDSTTEVRLASDKGGWERWTTRDLGAQTGVEVTESAIDGDRATLVVRSAHERGDGRVDLSMVRIDGVWKVQSWHSSRPLPPQ